MTKKEKEQLDRLKRKELFEKGNFNNYQVGEKVFENDSIEILGRYVSWHEDIKNWALFYLGMCTTCGAEYELMDDDAMNVIMDKCNHKL